ncbi:hypothetical protein GGX14DRAFT_669828 [Mycena pura]|uniref:DUF6533 domain-containing protein n=1 Tax=Mycena pura TaxID=153505 RepID=A0AAD6VTK0_9AGAR|nr:hypothetical protein GGX14DRAFT_669828 [Mycena pura]
MTMPAELASVVGGHVVEGRSFALASFMLFVWDYCITLDEEVRHFWSGPVSISRILFLCNRYFTLGLLAFVSHIGGFLSGPLSVPSILVLRLWYLFKSSKTARYTLLLAFLWCTAGTIATLVVQFPQLHSHLVHMPKRRLSYCADPPPSQFWLVFVPSFVLHGVLSLFMGIRVAHNLRTLKHLPLLKRFARDGGFLYMVIFFSVSFSISAAIVGVSPSVGVVAMFSNFMLALLSTCLSRVILHLSALSQAYVVDPLSKAPALLLHTALVDRVTWERKMGCIIFTPSVHDAMLDTEDEFDDYP